MASQEIPFVGPILTRLFGSSNDRLVKRYTMRVDRIAELESETRSHTDADLAKRYATFRDRHDKGEDAVDYLIEVFAVAREVMDRFVGIRNIFNPDRGFVPTVLPADAQRLYAKVAEEIAATPAAEPTGRFLGCAEAVPSWRFVDIPVRLYQAVREVYTESRPPFRARPFDVQLIGGMVLSQGKIAEMKTGEGKTIVAPLAAALAATERMQVHVVTVNDYLVQRDRDWTFPFFYGLGLTVGAIHPIHQQPEPVKQQMYRCDVVYGTTAEFGFDYLRDNMKRAVEQQVQRKRQFAVVDEVDSVLIDEARTPLIISGPAHDDNPRYDLADRLARHLLEKQKPWQEAEDEVTRSKERIKGLEGDIRQVRDRARVPELQAALAEEKSRLVSLEEARDGHTQYFELKLDRRQAYLTHDGISEAQRVAGMGSFYVGENQDLPHLLEQAVRAHAVYQRDKDYIVMDQPDRMTGRTEPSIVIVDVNTGRPMVGRQWSDGLHQAIEAKEKVPIKQETQTVASVTVQNFFKMYKRIAGMTGTADTEAQEFKDIYGMDVVAIPTNRSVVRRDHDDLMFLRAKDKWEAIVDEIRHFNDLGRPVLVGTTSVEKSEMLSRMLTKKHGVKHEVLNAKQHEREAHIVEDAGQLGAVMIATNMAGRGTDIKLGRSDRAALLDHWLRRGVAGRGLTPESSEQELRENVFRKIASEELKDEMRDQGLSKADLTGMPFDELELRLLRHWAAKNTWLAPKQIETLGREQLMSELDASGRIGLHRVRWYQGVEDLGGLHVIGTERHESRRIDNQLRGRSGRQGDKGSSRFYVSLEDDLMKMFAGETTQRLLARMGMREGDAIEHPWLSKNVENAQRKVEERNFQMRKNILEYDEVMEHQRRYFYGLRQRVLEGRNLRGLIFDYIEEAIDDAVAEMMDVEYPAICAAEHARRLMDCPIPHERLRGKDLRELEETIRRIAKDEAAATIGVTLGEYMPVEGSEVSVDFDSAGLIKWAKDAFGVELHAAELREGGAAERRHVRDMLEKAAMDRIDAVDLSGIVAYVERNYGARQLSEWVARKFGFEVSVDELIAAHADAKNEGRKARDPILAKARELYARREVEYPVEFVMEMTMVTARVDPARAFDELALWSRRRFGVGLTPDEIKRTPPQQMRQRFLEMQRKFVEEDRLGAAVAEAVQITSDDDLDVWMRKRYEAGVTERMRWLSGEEREDAVRARLENLLRTELIYFERTVLLDILDSSWKDHLYAMDQLKDTISYRAFSQQDPRIQYKREGSQLFTESLEGIRDRVTDLIFKARLSPALAAQRMGAPGGPPVGLPRPVGPAPIAAPPVAPAPRPVPPPAAGASPPAGASPAVSPSPAGGMLTGPGGFPKIAANRPPAGPTPPPASGDGGGA